MPTAPHLVEVDSLSREGCMYYCTLLCRCQIGVAFSPSDRDTAVPASFSGFIHVERLESARWPIFCVIAAADCVELV